MVLLTSTSRTETPPVIFAVVELVRGGVVVSVCWRSNGVFLGHQNCASLASCVVHRLTLSLVGHCCHVTDRLFLDQFADL